MRLKLFTVLNFVVRYQSICFACFIKKYFGRVILKTSVKPRFLMSPVLKSVFFINRVRVLWRQVRLFSKASPSVESGFFSSPGFVRVRVRVRVRSGFRSMPSNRHKINRFIMSDKFPITYIAFSKNKQDLAA